MARTISSMPKSFFGVLPLYIGVEIILGITIFNKCSGAYGILAVFTGHPLDFMQWVSYLWSVITLIVYVQGLYQIHKPRVYTFSQILVTFTLDTVVTCLFTLWFTAIWFSTDSVVSSDIGSLQKRGEAQSSQGASERYEYMVTIFITLTSLVFRFYFNYVLASFVQELLRNPKFLVDQDDVAQDLKNKNIITRFWIKSQRVSYHWCRRFLI